MFVNISGGVKVSETAADLAVVAAIISSFKNRFGGTNEVGIFEMTAKGLISAKDLANRFFTRGKAISGSALGVVMEGSRALVLEVQALVCESSYPSDFFHSL